MADTYFEVRNKDNVFQFSDNTRLLHIVDKKEFVAEMEKGEIYGVEIPEGIAGVSYWTREGTLYISPECTKDGKKIQYVTSSMEMPIRAYFWSEDYFPEMEHGAGLELRDGKGNIVFNNRGYLGSFKESFYTGVTTYQNYVSTEDSKQQMKDYSDVYYAPGFPMLYLALAVRFWGTYNEYDVTYSEDKSWFHREISKNCSIHGYRFGGVSGKPANTGNKEYEWVKLPNRGEFGNRPMERYLYSDFRYTEYRYWKGDDYYTKDDWEKLFGNAKPEKITVYGRTLPAGIHIKIDEKWDCITTPSASLMCPMNIWLPSLVGPEKDKNCCYAVGYEFTNIDGERHIRLAQEFEILRITTLKGAGSLEHLNKVIASGSEKGGWNEHCSRGEIDQFVVGKEYDYTYYYDGIGKILQWHENGELIAECCYVANPNRPVWIYNEYLGGRKKEEGGNWTITDGIACDLSMCHIVDIV